MDKAVSRGAAKAASRAAVHLAAEVLPVASRVVEEVADLRCPEAAVAEVEAIHSLLSSVFSE